MDAQVQVDAQHRVDAQVQVDELRVESLARGDVRVQALVKAEGRDAATDSGVRPRSAPPMRAGAVRISAATK